MFTTFQRICALTVALGLAAGASALANIHIMPSDNITLLTRVKGMGGNPDRENVKIVATSHSGKVDITANSCRPLTEVFGYETSSSGSSGTGHPSEQTHTASIRIQSKTQEGNCELTFADGSSTQIVRIRVVKP